MDRNDSEKLAKLVAEKAMRGEGLKTPDDCPICVIPSSQVVSTQPFVTSTHSETQFLVKKVDKMRSDR